MGWMQTILLPERGGKKERERRKKGVGGGGGGFILQLHAQIGDVAPGVPGL